MEKIFKFCKNFRTQVLNKTLLEICLGTETKLTTLSAFENGNSNNIKHLQIYIDNCNDQQYELFITELSKILRDK